MRVIYSKALEIFNFLVFPSTKYSVRGLQLFGQRLMVYIDQRTSRKIALRIFETAETKFFKNYIKPSDICLDIGANVGYYSILFASSGGDVISFEPVSQNATLLRLTAILNPNLNIKVLHTAVSDKNGTTDFIVSKQTSNSSLVSDQPLKHQGLAKDYSIEKIDTITIDSLKLDKLDIIKMDIEGAEFLALKGMKETLIRLKPRIIMAEVVQEHLLAFSSSLIEVLEFLKSIGYDPYHLVKGNLEKYDGGRPSNDNFFFLPIAVNQKNKS